MVSKFTAYIELWWKFLSYTSLAHCIQFIHRINLRSEMSGLKSVHIVNFNRFCQITFPPVLSACLILHSLANPGYY